MKVQEISDLTVKNMKLPSFHIVKLMILSSLSVDLFTRTSRMITDILLDNFLYIRHTNRRQNKTHEKNYLSRKKCFYVKKGTLMS